MRVLVALIVVLASGCWSRPPENVLVIAVGGLRPDHLGAYGATRNASPCLDALARQGFVFESAFAPSPVNGISLASLVTSQYPKVNGYAIVGDSLLSSAPHLAEELSRAGRETVAFLGDCLLHPSSGLGRGFDLYVNSSGRLPWEDIGEFSVTPEIISATREAEKASTAARITGDVLSWLETRDGSRPFFALVNHTDPAADFVAPASIRGAFAASYRGPMTGEGIRQDGRIQAAMDPVDIEGLRLLYDAEIRHVDGHLSKIFEALESRGLLAHTLVVVTGTFGQPFLEHGSKIAGAVLHDEEIRIPLIISSGPGWPGPSERAVPPGRTQGLVTLLDVAPTILDVLGLPPMKGAMGLSLGPQLKGAQDLPQRSVYLEAPLGQRTSLIGLRDAGRLVIRFPTQGWEIYDLVADPDQLRPRVLKPRDANHVDVKGLDEATRLLDDWAGGRRDDSMAGLQRLGLLP